MTDKYRLIYTPLKNTYELYDLIQDPQEKHNLIDYPDYRRQTQYLQARLHHIRKEDRLGLRIVNLPLSYSSDEKYRLKSLGYLH